MHGGFCPWAHLETVFRNGLLQREANEHEGAQVVYSYFKKGCRKNVHAIIPKGNMGCDQYTVPDTVAVEPAFVDFL